jgi:hypothetical protein
MMLGHEEEVIAMVGSLAFVLVAALIATIVFGT